LVANTRRGGGGALLLSRLFCQDSSVKTLLSRLTERRGEKRREEKREEEERRERELFLQEKISCIISCIHTTVGKLLTLSVSISHIQSRI
jgi:hypothetical protein